MNNWSPDKNFDLELFIKIFDNLDKKYDEIKIYAVYGEDLPTIKEPNKLYVQFSGESYYNNPDMFDINFIATQNINNNIYLPEGILNLFALTSNINDLMITEFLKPRNLKSVNDKFCIFAVSNGGCDARNTFFTEISKYKTVDSCGKHLNNLGYNCPGKHSSKESTDFFSKYKFMICFENVSKPNYCSEKLFNAYLSGTIPIYWGDPNISSFINMDAIFYLKSNFTNEELQKLIDDIRILDMNDDLYKKKYEQPLFQNNEIVSKFNIKSIQNEINKILL